MMNILEYTYNLFVQINNGSDEILINNYIVL